MSTNILELRRLLGAMSSCLTQYIAVHDELFSFSLRRLIPIPFIFQKIDYAQHANALSTVQARLVQLRSGFAQHGATAELPLAYLEQLSATMRKLEEICVRLAKKANGESYRYSDYNADVDAYDALVKIYTASGKRLNTWMTSLSTRPPSSR
jgi:hypothetical protein